jgi:hypothetical protein
MYSDRQLNDTQVGSKVAARLADVLDQERSDLQAQLM